MKKIYMNTGLLLFVMSGILVGCSTKENAEFGLFEKHADIGECQLPGNFISHPEKNFYSIIASGENMWFDSDQFHYAWLETDEDFVLRARIEFIGEGKNAHRKMGIMVRNSADTSSMHVSGVVHGDGLTALQYRKGFGENTEEVKTEVSGPDAIQIEKQGATFTFTVARGGEIAEPLLLENSNFDPGAMVGLFMCSHDNTVAEKGNFMDVTMFTGKKKHASFEEFVNGNE
jgi:TolB protein